MAESDLALNLLRDSSEGLDGYEVLPYGRPKQYRRFYFADTESFYGSDLSASTEHDWSPIYTAQELQVLMGSPDIEQESYEEAALLVRCSRSSSIDHLDENDTPFLPVDFVAHFTPLLGFYLATDLLFQSQSKQGIQVGSMLIRSVKHLPIFLFLTIYVHSKRHQSRWQGILFVSSTSAGLYLVYAFETFSNDLLLDSAPLLAVLLAFSFVEMNSALMSISTITIATYFCLQQLGCFIA